MSTMTLSPEVAALRWPSRYPDLFAGLTDEQAVSVHDAIANGVLEGWNPTHDDVAEQCAHAGGRLSVEQVVASARASAAARTRAARDAARGRAS